MLDESSATRRIRALRGAKSPVDPRLPLGVLCDSERTAAGHSAPCVTVFLAGSECPFSCSFCDLWRRTLDGATPEGALPAQVAAALAEVGPTPAGARLKLYNASNFFDPRAVPVTDLERLAALSAPFERLIVECHPRLVDRRAVEFAASLPVPLEVAMGLETIHPQILPRLNKEMTLDDFDRAARTLRDGGIGLRAFVLIGPPGLVGPDSVDWAVVSTAYALDRGAETVTLIPVRSGNGELDRLASVGEFREPALIEIETAFERALALEGGVVLLDPWDLERFARCPDCRNRRLARLARMNDTGVVQAPVDCGACVDA